MNSEKLSAVVAVAAMAISVAIAATAVRIDAASFQKVRQAWITGSVLPASGALLGIRAQDGLEWAAASGVEHEGVLFGLAEAGQTGDIEFWRKVAEGTRKTAPGMQFVGLCDPRRICKLPPAFESQLTLLKFMDPVETHALAKNAIQGRLFIFRGSKVTGMLEISKDPQALASRIAGLSFHRAKLSSL